MSLPAFPTCLITSFHFFTPFSLVSHLLPRPLTSPIFSMFLLSPMPYLFFTFYFSLSISLCHLHSFFCLACNPLLLELKAFLSLFISFISSSFPLILLSFCHLPVISLVFLPFFHLPTFCLLMPPTLGPLPSSSVG